MERSLQNIINVLEKRILNFPFVRSWIEGFRGVLAAH